MNWVPADHSARGMLAGEDSAHRHDQCCQRDGRAGPEEEQPAYDFHFLLCEASVHPREPHIQFSEARIHLTPEPLPVQFVDVAQLILIGCVHSVEPLHQLGGDVVAEPLVELPGKFGRDGQVRSSRDEPDC
jgi:hypothetical protein